MLLVTIGLVVVGAVSLVIGFVQNSLPPIYVSIVCSLLAAAVLVVFSRLSRRQAATVAVGGGVPLGGVRGAPAAAPARSPEVAEELTVVPSPPRREAAFPIADYDDLKVAEILPLLEELDDEELHQVLDREQADRDRATIVRRVEELLRPTVVVLGARGRDDEPAGGPVGAGEEDDVVFPIADYDELRIGEILPLLPELDDVAGAVEAHRPYVMEQTLALELVLGGPIAEARRYELPDGRALHVGLSRAERDQSPG